MPVFLWMTEARWKVRRRRATQGEHMDDLLIGNGSDKGGLSMEERMAEVMTAVKPGILNWIGAAIGVVIAWWTGLPILAQALLIVQGADVLTGLLCAATGKSDKSASGKVSSGALVMGLVKKGLEWLVVLICVYVGLALGVESVSAAAMTYMMATELVSLMENLNLFGLDIPLLRKLLDVAQGTDSQA